MKEERDNESQIFWLDKIDGECKGGYFIRNNLKEFFKKLEESGKKPVGIKYDGSYNLEIIIQENG